MGFYPLTKIHLNLKKEVSIPALFSLSAGYNSQQKQQ